MIQIGGMDSGAGLTVAGFTGLPGFFFSGWKKLKIPFESHSHKNRSLEYHTRTAADKAPKLISAALGAILHGSSDIL
jgi:hypothetical protein